jgi:hypothetical protein
MRLILILIAAALAGCMDVRICKYGRGNITVNLDKPVSVVPSLQADGNDIKIPMIP